LARWARRHAPSFKFESLGCGVLKLPMKPASDRQQRQSTQTQEQATRWLRHGRRAAAAGHAGDVIKHRLNISIGNA
jgi:hypothetical protein